MHRLGQYLVAAALSTVIALPAMSQERRSQRPGADAESSSAIHVLGAKDVQKELKLTDDQIAKVAAVATKQREAGREGRNLERDELIRKRREMNQEGERTAVEILKPDQAKRFKEIRLQQKQTRAFIDEAVAKELNFTDDQIKKIKDLQDESRAKRQEIIGARGEGRGGAQSGDKLIEFNKAFDEKMLGVLSSEQKVKWKEMLGEPFKGEIPRVGARRPGAERRDP